MEKTYRIYLVRNLVNGKMYVGQTYRPVKVRWKQHCCLALDRGGALRLAIKKYGRVNFDVEVIEDNISESAVDDRERYWIQQFNSLAPAGYNLETGGNKNKTCSEETRRKLSESHRGQRRPRSEAFKEHMRNVMKGRKPSLATIEGFKKSKPSMLGRKFTEEHKQKIRESNLGKPHPKHTEQWKQDMSRRFSGVNNPSFGVPVSAERRAKISASKKGTVSGECNPFYGKTHSPESVAKWRASMLRRKQCQSEFLTAK